MEEDKVGDEIYNLMFIALPMPKLSIYRRWFLFGMSTDVNFRFEPKE